MALRDAIRDRVVDARRDPAAPAPSNGRTTGTLRDHRRGDVPGVMAGKLRMAAVLIVLRSGLDVSVADVPLVRGHRRADAVAATPGAARHRVFLRSRAVHAG